jgi:pimeloyl-ACP methyl ester carboxylesterase
MRVEVEPGVRLFVDIDGARPGPDGASGWRDKPVLVLVHGGPGFDHTGFKPFFSRFTDQVKLLYLDQRGHGRSDPRPAHEWTLDTWADDLVRLCGVLGIERPIVLGQSFGGFVVQRYLARHPDHPRAAVLSSTASRYNLEGKVAGFARRGGLEAGAAARAFWEQPSAETWAVYDRLCRHLYNTTPQDAASRPAMVFRPEILFHSAGGEQRRMNLLPGLAAVRCPVLVLAGDEDPVTPMDDAELIHEALPPAWRQIERFAGVGHGPWRDDPVATERVLRAWLAAQA